MVIRKTGIKFKCLFQAYFCFLLAAHDKTDLPKPSTLQCVERIQYNSPASQTQRLLKTAEACYLTGGETHNCGISRIKGESALQGSSRSDPIPIDKHPDPADLRMGLCQIWIQRQGLFHSFPRLPLALRRGHKAVVGFAKVGEG